MKIKFIALVSFAITVFAACSNTASQPTTTTIEKAATIDTNGNVTIAVLPIFKVISIDGRIINLADLKGKKVLVNLWSTWCPPCKAEIPSIEKLWAKVNHQKTAFVLLSLDENFKMAKLFFKTNKIQLPMYYPAERLPEMFKTNGIPVTFIFNEKGELIKENNGMEDYDTDIYLRMLK